MPRAASLASCLPPPPVRRSSFTAPRAVAIPLAAIGKLERSRHLEEIRLFGLTYAVGFLFVSLFLA